MTIVSIDPYLRWVEKVNKGGPPPAVNPELGGCWLWLAGRSDNGYGVFYPGKVGGSRYAHRWSYGHHVGPIPGGLDIDHLCRVRHCVNPAHLEPVTATENQKRGKKATQTHCKRGHEFTPDSTYRRPRPPHTRACKLCRDILRQESKMRR